MTPTQAKLESLYSALDSSQPHDTETLHTITLSLIAVLIGMFEPEDVSELSNSIPKSDRAFALSQFSFAITELSKQKAAHPHWPDDPVHAFNVVNKMVADMQRAVLRSVYGKPESPDAMHEIKSEAYRLIASTIRFLKNMPKYDWTPSDQHED